MKIKLDQFEGPLDLLLHLIEEDKLDITQISLAHVTEQFLEYLRTLQTLNPAALADWLVVAAKLLVIKSKALIPSLELEPEEEESATNLAWQLWQYRRYKEAAKHLRQIESRGLQGFGRGRGGVFFEASFFPDPAVTSSALRDAMRFLGKTLEELMRLPKQILGEVVTISEKINHLQKTIAEKVELKLRDLVAASKSKTEVIVTFLALLELVKQKILTVDQETIFSEILIKKNSSPPSSL